MSEQAGENTMAPTPPRTPRTPRRPLSRALSDVGREIRTSSLPTPPSTPPVPAPVQDDGGQSNLVAKPGGIRSRRYVLRSASMSSDRMEMEVAKPSGGALSNGKPRKNDPSLLEARRKEVQRKQVEAPTTPGRYKNGVMVEASPSTSGEEGDDGAESLTRVEGRIAVTRQRSEALSTLSEGGEAAGAKREGFFYFH
mmetsp:Transcript_7873/g.20490  ORF Transcript_7873/g.20490 Transcript_7873/m.20490 type:complete len:196 (-) Transcript_7873:2411-2998(-)